MPSSTPPGVLRAPRWSMSAGAVGAAVVAGMVFVAAPALGGESASSTPVRIVHAFNDLFGKHEGHRVVHAKGLISEGVFAPSPDAAAVTRATHFQAGSFPAVVRFSDFAGMPAVASGSAQASPRGMSIKFMLPDGTDTDIVAHSYNGFPAATPAEFLEFLQAVGASGSDVPSPTPLDRLAASRPAVRAFLDDPKPIPSSYAAEAFFGVNAFRFENAEGRSVFGRYRIEPLGGTDYLEGGEAAAKDPDFLRTEFSDRLERGPVRFRIVLQIADPGDDVVDGTAVWPGDRREVDLGTLTLHRAAARNAEVERRILFTPLNLVDGIDSSGDPMLAARSRAYAKSYSMRSPREASSE